VFGSNRKAREPSSAHLSDRKLAGSSGGGASGGSGSTNRSSSRGSRGGCGGGCGTVLVVIVAVIYYLLTGGEGIDFDSDDDSSGYSGSLVIEDASNVLSSSASTYTWLETAATPAAKKAYTIMVYMNGSNLESDYGLATTDLGEMMGADIDPDAANVLILTGGCKQWHSGITKTLSIYKAGQDSLERIADLGSGSIVDTALMKSFINFCATAYPADKYGFVFWDHGGGTLYGYGSDELHSDASMSISGMKSAFSQTKLADKGFEFIGFDCCLMATIEIADYIEPFAKYMIASEETEPGTGWDYEFLSDISASPSVTGDALGKKIVDLFIASNEDGSTQATLSVTELGKLSALKTSFESFSAAADADIAKGGFTTISKARKNARSFGNMGQDESFDLVDIGSLAQNLSAAYPTQASQVVNDLASCVIYAKATSVVKNASGLSTYIPYASKSDAARNTASYQKLGILPRFSSFLASFTEKLTGRKVERTQIAAETPALDSSGSVYIQLDQATLADINAIHFVVWRQESAGSDYFLMLGNDSGVEIASDGTIKTAFNGYWAKLGGREASFFEIEKTEAYTLYAVPALLNDEDVNIWVVINDDYPDGIVLGAVPASTETVAPRALIQIEDGDKVQFKFRAQLFLPAGQSEGGREAEKWVYSEAFTVSNSLESEVYEVGNELYLYGFWIEDVYNNNYYTQFIEITF